MTRTIGVPRARRFPRLDFDSQIAVSGKTKWPVRFNATDPKMPVVNDPIRGAAQKVIDMTVRAEWGGGGTTANNPRGQLEAPRVLYEGAQVWVSFSLLLQAGMQLPVLPTDWNAFFQLHGISATGYPSFRLGFEGGSGFGWRREPAKGSTWACPITPQYGAWMDFAIAVHMHRDPAQGWIELWTNFGSGWVQRSLAPSAGDTLVGKRLYTETITAGYTGLRYASHIQNYRKAGYAASIAAHHGDHRQVPIVNYAAEASALVAGTFTALDPRSYA